MRNIVIDDSRGFKGVWIPKEIYTISELSWTEKILLVEIINLHELGKCYASNKHFADMLGITKRQASKAVSKLIDLGYIRSEVFREEETKEVTERILIPMEQKFVRGYRTKVREGIEQKAEEKNTLPKESTSKENNEILVHDSEKPTVKPTGKESWDSEPLYNKRYGIPINLGEMSDEETDIWYEAIDYFIEKHKQWSIKPHRKHKPDYWRRYTIETSIKICLRGFTVTTELVHRIIDYYFDIEHPRGNGEWSMMCSDKNMNGILVKLFGGSRSDRESAGMLEPKEVWEYSFARERELDLV